MRVHKLHLYSAQDEQPTGPAGTVHRAKTGSKLVHRLRRRPNIETTLVKCLSGNSLHN